MTGHHKFNGSISFLVGESDSPSPDFGRGEMPLIPSSPQGISRDGTCLPGFGSGVVDSATEASTSKDLIRKKIRYAQNDIVWYGESVKYELISIRLLPRPISGEGWGEGILDSYDTVGVFLSLRRAASCFCCREFTRTVVGTLSLSTNFLMEPFFY